MRQSSVSYADSSLSPNKIFDIESDLEYVISKQSGYWVLNDLFGNINER